MEYVTDVSADVMVELNFDLRRPDALPDLDRVRELRDWDVVGGTARAGHPRALDQLAARDRLPALAMASSSVAASSLGGAGLGAALPDLPACDAYPLLLAAGAVVGAESFQRGVSRPLRHGSLDPEELIRAVVIPTGIAVCSFALALDLRARVIETGIGAAGPTPLAARAAARFLAAELDWGTLAVSEAAAARFGKLVARAAQPVDGVRGPGYRRRALEVLAIRALGWIRSAA
ncbi:MAG TPA: xanthine dehydrogenase family protein subunit M [Actinospica sp.]|nr:xanthine dehydrogenase family protein subunit M [Actinospica sp.]